MVIVTAHLRGESCTEMTIIAEYCSILLPSLSPQNPAITTMTQSVTGSFQVIDYYS